MRRMVLITFLFIMIPVFAGYKVVFKNGAVLDLLKTPDFTGRMVKAETVDGKKIIFPAAIVDLKATEKANQPRPVVQDKERKKAEIVSGSPVKKESPKPGPVKTREGGKLVITEATIGKQEKKESKQDAEKKAAEMKARINSNVASEDTDRMGSNEYLDDAGHGEKYWHGKFQENKAMQAAVQAEIEKTQLEMNRLSSESLQTDSDVYQRQLTGQIQKLRVKLEQLKKQLTDLKQQKETLLETARRLGALPAWYRDYAD